MKNFYQERNKLYVGEVVMTMSKEMERLKSKISFNKALINIYDNMNFVSKSNKYDKKIEEYQNELSKIYKRIQELKEVEE